jgi:hypothetical protein
MNLAYHFVVFREGHSNPPRSRAVHLEVILVPDCHPVDDQRAAPRLDATYRTAPALEIRRTKQAPLRLPAPYVVLVQTRAGQLWVAARGC